ncbi:hypothetical protein QIH80_34310 [Bradyrhizobium elkanii]|nr:hypothetical protein QIH80_34310 [Bradyrhizobium elkanii]
MLKGQIGGKLRALFAASLTAVRSARRTVATHHFGHVVRFALAKFFAITTPPNSMSRWRYAEWS